MKTILANGIVSRLLVGMVVITTVTLVSQYSRRLGGILAVMPVNIPLVLWIVYSTSGSRPEAIAPMAQGMVWGLVPTVIFVIVCSYTLRLGWTLPRALLVSYAVWALTALIPGWLWPESR